MRFLPVSLTTLLVELADLDQTLALLASLQVEPLAGIEDMVPAARTLMIRFQPAVTSAERLAADLVTRDLSKRAAASDHWIEIPVHYDGEDLETVAELTGLTIAEVIRRHTNSAFTVAFCGFAPGFGYLTGGDPALHVPRRQSPRTQIPAGSVALAGAFSGIYPQASPGGWQIIGTTPLKMWDIERDPPALFQPGHRVRFVAVEAGAGRARSSDLRARPDPTSPLNDPALEVLAAPFPALFQDLGRFGQAGQGVSSAGALDRAALKAANRAVGNPEGTACLELLLGGFSVRARRRTVAAIAGAEVPLTLVDATGRSLEAEVYRPLSLEPGDVLTVGQPERGMRSYLALRGGFAVEPVLGSASTDTLAVVGPAPVTAGSVLGRAVPAVPTVSISLDEGRNDPLPSAGDIVTLDVIMGPRTDWFTQAGVSTLTSQLWQVTPQSNRVGIRLAGALGIERRDQAELPSEGTATGAIQVPHNGQPVLFLADHPLTGGYPVIATLADYHLDLAGQIPVNARIAFRPIRPFQEIRPQADRDHVRTSR